MEQQFCKLCQEYHAVGVVEFPKCSKQECGSSLVFCISKTDNRWLCGHCGHKWEVEKPKEEKK